MTEPKRTLSVIAHYRCGLPEKFGVPRQSGLVPNLEGRVVFTPAYRSPEALRGLEGFSHLWLLWDFSENGEREGNWSPTVRPPRLGGNRRVGVFATRSPNRPNPIGLSCVSLLAVEEVPGLGLTLRVGGGDLTDGTPIYDIKPYLPFTDSRPEAKGGFADRVLGYALDVNVPDEIRRARPDAFWEAVCSLLAQDPRPSYQKDPDRIYGMKYEKSEIRFRVADGCAFVISVSEDETAEGNSGGFL
ncbi:MAG: tRNA (N6-threonylcarbamoyladenosine(37)-N6)-methyltransferase TrmO [Clostridia bacterium]|nr:tRNA (N6-threonylcarbamoyladenosine(37)-N6)-methyltransferase TrmO [Clostridia bacterium]